VDAGVETGSGSATITLHIPRQDGQSFFRDGKFVLKPGMEVNIYFRGYFPVQGMLQDVQPNVTGGVDVRNSVMYPYYHVFHGVVTETSYEYSGGEHTASLSCADMLHFWSYQVMSTSGSAFGARPTNSGLKFTLTGHSFRAMTPYSIMYTLYRDVMGAAGGVSFSLGQATSANAKAETGDSAWSLALLYWEKRFGQNFNSLRMYGTDGTLYNAYQQAFLGRLSTQEVETLAKTFADPALASREHDPVQPNAKVARLLNYDPGSAYLSAESQKDAEKGGLGINVAQMQAYTTDLGAMGSVNLWESTYETKMDMAQQVAQVAGYEFYQDVDGDFVFKPPFYNLDTSSNRVYVLKDIDLISITFVEAEPEVTALKVSSGWFGNMTGTSVENNEFGPSGSYIDYRLVAQFGWRQQTFEAAYLTDPKALFYACVARMDIFNLNMNRANCQIPLRPELRIGFPVYLESFDCYYYLTSFNHTFSFGGQCTTSLTLTGRRAKFYAPGTPPQDGSKPTIEDIKLSDPWLPPLPLPVVGNDGIPRLQGFPNVVMAIDQNLLNPTFFSVGLNLKNLGTEAGIQSLLRKAKAMGILEIDDEGAGNKGEREKLLEGPFRIRTGRETTRKIASPSDLLEQVLTYQKAYNQMYKTPGSSEGSRRVTTDRALAEEAAADVQAILDAILGMQGHAMEGGDVTSNYLTLLGDLKSNFAPGLATPGYYRYYSASHPDPEQQGMRTVVADERIEDTTQSAGLILLDPPVEVLGFKTVGGETKMVPIEVRAGVPLMLPNSGVKGAEAVPVGTHNIATLSFSQSHVNKEIQVPQHTGNRKPSFDARKLQDILDSYIRRKAEDYDGSIALRWRINGVYQTMSDRIALLPSQLAITNLKNTTVPTLDQAFLNAKAPKGERTDSGDFRGKKIDLDNTLGAQYRNEAAGLGRVSQWVATVLTTPAIACFQNAYKEREAQVGALGQPKNKTAEGVVQNSEAYALLDRIWTDLILTMVGEDQVVSIQGNKSGSLVVQVPSYSKVATYTPVFPVSDQRGYEVIGSYAYGRGLSIEPGGNFQQLHNADLYGMASIDAVDAFVSSLLHKTSPSAALGVLTSEDPEGAAQIAASTAEFLSNSSDEQIRKLDVNDPDQFDIGFQAFMASSKDFTQKISPTNAAFGLANLGLLSSRAVCSCKGAEADVLLEAYGQESFVSLDQPDLVSSWVADQMLQKSKSWKTAQEAFRGTIQDKRNQGIAEQYANIKDQVGSDTRSSLDALSQAAQDLKKR